MKSKFLLLLLIQICFSICYSQTTPFVHYATSANISGEITEIDNAQINNDPNAIIVVEKVRYDDGGTIVNNPHFVGLGYNSINGKWYIHNENPSDAMIVNSCYLIYTPPVTLGQAFQHIADAASILFGYQNTSQILNVLINDNSLARCKINRAYDNIQVQNNNATEMYYNWMNPGVWYVTTPPGTTIPINSGYNCMCDPSGFTNYEHTTTFDNIGSEVNSVTDYSYWTILDHVLLNNNPNAWFFVNHRREPSTGTIYRSFSTFYNSIIGKWQLHIELENYISGFSFPIGYFFDLFIWDGTLEIDEFETTNTFKVYPNPSNSKFTVEANQNISNISVYNVLGQKLDEFSSVGENILQIDLSKYEFGHYFAKIAMSNATETVKLIKN